jgi:hypothetical protein
MRNGVFRLIPWLPLAWVGALKKILTFYHIRFCKVKNWHFKCKYGKDIPHFLMAIGITIASQNLRLTGLFRKPHQFHDSPRFDECWNAG